MRTNSINQMFIDAIGKASANKPVRAVLINWETGEIYQTEFYSEYLIKDVAADYCKDLKDFSVLYFEYEDGGRMQ